MYIIHRPWTGLGRVPPQPGGYKPTSDRREDLSGCGFLDMIMAYGPNEPERCVHESTRGIHRFRRGTARRKYSGETLEEARANLNEAVAMVLDANRALSAQSLEGAEVIRETLLLHAA